LTRKNQIGKVDKYEKFLELLLDKSLFKPTKKFSTPDYLNLQSNLALKSQRQETFSITNFSPVKFST
jgi:hypothetical protein